MDPADVVERIKGKALAMELGEVSVHYRGSTGGEGWRTSLTLPRGKGSRLLRLLPQDPTSENREGLLDQQIKKVLQALSQTDLSLRETPRDFPEE